MDATKRQITKIAREVNKLTLHTMRESGIGTGEFDLIHLVRHEPGISQKEISCRLNMDKGAVARRVASWNRKDILSGEETLQTAGASCFTPLIRRILLKIPSPRWKPLFMNGL